MSKLQLNHTASGAILSDADGAVTHRVRKSWGPDRLTLYRVVPAPFGCVAGELVGSFSTLGEAVAKAEEEVTT